MLGFLRATKLWDTQPVKASGQDDSTQQLKRFDKVVSELLTRESLVKPKKVTVTAVL